MIGIHNFVIVCVVISATGGTSVQGEDKQLYKSTNGAGIQEILKRLQKQLSIQQKVLTEERNQVREMKEEDAKRKAEIKGLQKELSTQQKALTEETSQMKDLQDETKQLRGVSGRITTNQNSITTNQKSITGIRRDMNYQISSVSGRITTNQNSITTNQNSITTNQNSITGVRRDMSNQISGVSGRITRNQNSITAIHRDVQLLQSSLAPDELRCRVAPPVYYPKNTKQHQADRCYVYDGGIKATFVGYGWPTFKSCTTINDVQWEECLRFCYKRMKNDAQWKGCFWDSKYRHCINYLKPGRGLSHSNNNCLYYVFNVS